MDSAAYVVRTQVVAAPLNALPAVYWHRLMIVLQGGRMDTAVTFNMFKQESIQWKDTPVSHWTSL